MTGRVVLVAGGTSGVGSSVVDRCLESGDRVFVTGTNQARLAARLATGDGTLLAGELADLADQRACERTAQHVLELYGQVDAVVIAAGVGASGDLATGDPGKWRDMTVTNVLGPPLLVRATLPAVRDAGGQFIFIGSVFGRKPAPGSLYAATKGALTALAESLRQQLVGTGVRTCIIQPGRIDTPWWPQGAPPPALSAAEVANAVQWVIERPSTVDVNEIVLRPTGQQF
jgi:NADP-dependent 3-hydroxy acid dehydrogenase YdfG